MIVKVQRWGNSLALRIPKSFASEVNLEPGSRVNLSLRGRRIVISPISQEYSMEELVSRINESNVHREISTGDPMGKELW
ncbi:MAG TPA: AbrB/MazE/SpoVT family DNA-binding domain-containing protein [Firmicutes bacterium]|nr:AbrB/MazE/SpoVT family DNA-binding domain-containing protein [Bacillota bacterium]HHY97587.1 AbrB/MazE/SpoVT family DNA-binding domain-containing protein [Bacillota bacterium]